MDNINWTKEYTLKLDETDIIWLSSTKDKNEDDFKYMVRNDKTNQEWHFKCEERLEAENVFLKEISDQITKLKLITRLLKKHKTKEWTNVLTFTDKMVDYSLILQTMLNISGLLKINIIYVEDNEIEEQKSYEGFEFEYAENYFIRMTYEYLCTHSL